MKISESSFEHNLLPVLTSHLAIDKYGIYLETIRSFRNSILYHQYSKQLKWLDALVYYKANSWEDAFYSINDYLSFNQDELKLYTKVG
jgi:hypothetical protein